MLKKLIQKIKESSERRMKEAEVRDIENAFDITVKDGDMYIVCGTRAVSRIDKQASVNDALISLNSMIDAAKNYQFGKNKVQIGYSDSVTIQASKLVGNLNARMI